MKSALIGFILFLFIIRFIIQTHLDYKHKRFKGLPNPNMAFSCMLPYIKPVKQEFENEKVICNLLYQLWLLSIVVTLLYSFFISLKL